MKPFVVLFLIAAISGCSSLGQGPGIERLDARAAIEALQDVEGDWSGEFIDGPWINEGNGGEGVEGEGEARLVDGRYHVTAGGSVVEATLFKDTPRETVMMFHMDGRKLMLTQYGEARNSTSLEGVAWKQSPREPNGVFIRFSSAGATHPDSSDDEYLHHVFVLITQDGTEMWWTFFEDGAPTRLVYVELTKRNSPATANTSMKG